MIPRVPMTGLLAAALCSVGWGASWNHVLYVGGTVAVKTGGYDWNTTLTIASDSIVVTIDSATVFSPSRTVRIKPSQVTAIWYGASAWKHVGEVPGAHLPSKPPSLFGMMSDAGDASMAIIYELPDGKRGALLFESPQTAKILLRLKEVTGKVMEKSP